MSTVDLIQPADANIDANPELFAFFRMLDDAFGPEAWSVNNDVRYSEELSFRPIDVTATLESQTAFAEKAMDLERRMLAEHHARVLVFVGVPLTE